jgi:N-acetylglutamate synthase-like GNAT family acetyltransferase
VGESFIPGAYWTADRAAASVRAMTAQLVAPETQAMFAAIANATHEGQDPAVASAALSGVEAAGGGGPIARDACIFRRGRTGDETALARLIVEGNLPPFFIDPFLDGFLVVEHEGEIVACGCAEMYGDTSVIRSVVVSTRGRGLGLGIETGRLLEDDARHSGATDIYLFTLEAWAFWKRLRYIDVPLDEWREPARANWQYHFMRAYPDAVADVHSMWKRA